MTKASNGDEPTGAPAEDHDDLTAIKGIGAKTQSWLNDSLEVRTFHDLAALSADDIDARLRAEGRVISRPTILGWIERAAKAAEAVPAAGQTSRQFAKTSSKASAGSPAAENDWKPFASFVVEFQARNGGGGSEQRRTTVHHMEDDMNKMWPGIEGEQLCRWMLDCVGKETQERPATAAERATETESPVKATPTARSSVNVEITRVRVGQPSQAETPLYAGGASHPGFVEGGQPFVLEVSFDLTGQGAAAVAKRHKGYRAQFYAHNLSTAARKHLGSTVSAVTAGDSLSYTVVLPGVTLEPGMYRLDCLAVFEGGTVHPGYREVPMLQVA